MYNCEEMPSNKLIGFEVLKNVYDEAVDQYQPLDKNNDKQEYAGVNIIYAVLVRLATFFYYTLFIEVYCFLLHVSDVIVNKRTKPINETSESDNEGLVISWSHI